MTLAPFLLTTAAISASGALAPGPVTAVAVGQGSGSRHAGAMIAIGHAMVEVPLVLLMVVGLGAALARPGLQTAIALCGGACLIVMGVTMARAARGARVETAAVSRRGPLAAGVLLSATNPYFYLWWATVGLELIVQARAFGAAGFSSFVVVHWLCDLGWLWFLSALSFKGGQFFGRKFQVGAFVVCGALLVVFGAVFAFGAARALLG
jgi:threonine/homoserine/homoserine lactone efflux protein